MVGLLQRQPMLVCETPDESGDPLTLCFLHPESVSKLIGREVVTTRWQPTRHLFRQARPFIHVLEEPIVCEGDLDPLCSRGSGGLPFRTFGGVRLRASRSGVGRMRGGSVLQAAVSTRVTHH